MPTTSTVYPRRLGAEMPPPLGEPVARVFYRATVYRFITVFTASLLALVLASLASLSIGSGGLCLPPWRTECSLLVGIRATRLVAALATGAVLAYSGFILQNATRNPLAEPYILGLSSGALAATSMGILFSGASLLYAPHVLSLLAFTGSLAAYAATVVLSERGGGTTSSLILAGIAVNIVFSGVAELVLFLVQLLYSQPLLILLVGSLAYVQWDDLYPLLVVAVSSVALLPLIVKPLNTLIFGDEYTVQLGYDPKWLRRVIATMAALLTGAAVAVTGIIGFIGLLAPHIARMVLGTSDARYALPLSITLGGLLLLGADMVARTASLALSIGELPVGVYASLMGGPFLAYLIATRMKGFAA